MYNDKSLKKLYYNVREARLRGQALHPIKVRESVIKEFYKSLEINMCEK